MLSSIEGSSTLFRKPYLNTIAPSLWPHCGKNSEVTRAKQFWSRMQLHKASIPLVLGSGPPGGRLCLMSVCASARVRVCLCVCIHLLTSTSLQQCLPVGMPDTAVPTDVSHIHRHGTRGEVRKEMRGDERRSDLPYLASASTQRPGSTSKEKGVEKKKCQALVFPRKTL